MENNENNGNIGFVGSEGVTQYSNPYQSDLYSEPDIKLEAKRIAEQNKRASQEILSLLPPPPSSAPPAKEYTLRQQDITNLDFITASNNELDSNNNNINNNNINNNNINNNTIENNIDNNIVTSITALDKQQSSTMDLREREQTNSKQYLFKNTTLDVIDNDDEKSIKPPRKHTVCCLCCPLWLCCGITIGVIVLIGVITFIFWPKIPEVSIASIQLSESSAEPVRYEIPTPENNNSGGVKIDLDIHINVKNDNFYGLSVNSLDTRVYLGNDGISKSKIGTGGAKKLKFPKHQTTEFVLPLTIGYYTEQLNHKDNDALLYLLKACATQSDIQIQYEVDIGIFLVETIYKPTYKGSNLSFKCPVSEVANNLSSILIGDIYNSISQYFQDFL